MLTPDIISIRGKWGDDVVFIAEQAVKAVHNDVKIDSSVGVIRRTARKDTVCLVAGGRALKPFIEVKGIGPATRSGESR